MRERASKVNYYTGGGNSKIASDRADGQAKNTKSVGATDSAAKARADLTKATQAQIVRPNDLGNKR